MISLSMFINFIYVNPNDLLLIDYNILISYLTCWEWWLLTSQTQFGRLL